MQLCMNEVCILQSGDLLSHIEACAAHGFHHMEIRKSSLLQYMRSGGTLEELKRTLDRCEVTPACLNSIESISFNNKRGMRVLKEMSEYLFFCCKSIGCNCVEVIGSFKVPTEDPREIQDNTVEALRQLSDVATPYGIKLALEYMAMPGSSVNSFGQALDIVNGAARPNVGILLDTWHHYAMGSAPEEIGQARSDQIHVVHISDCPAYAPGKAPRTESYLPGDGVVDLSAMLRQLKGIGYDGVVSVEVMDPALQAMPAAQLLEQSHMRTQPLLDALC